MLLLLAAAGALASCAHDDCWCGSDVAHAKAECKNHNAKLKCDLPGSTSYCASLTPAGLPLFKCIGNVTCGQPVAPTPAPTPDTRQPWQTWLTHFGRDSFIYPSWISEQMGDCKCTFPNGAEGPAVCVSGETVVDWRMAGDGLTFCMAKAWLLNHMPTFDKYFLPPSVTVRGANMLDDNIAFALMADNASKFSSNIPLSYKLAYILPYATFHESRTNWRPLFFAKYFGIAANAHNTSAAIAAVFSPPYHHGLDLNWSAPTWVGEPGNRNDVTKAVWASSTSPPVVGPFDFAAYGYSSCTGWAVTLSYIARAAGVPARAVGSPCWNGGDFAGLAKDNPNVTQCWNGGNVPGNVTGGNFLYNHNWVEYYDDVKKEWVVYNVPTGGGLCNWNKTTGCNYDPSPNASTGRPKGCSGAGAASKDHEILCPTWTKPEEASPMDGGSVVDVANLKLTNGEAVSPLVWSPLLTSPMGESLKDDGLRVVNRTDFYRCKEP